MGLQLQSERWPSPILTVQPFRLPEKLVGIVNLSLEKIEVKAVIVFRHGVRTNSCDELSLGSYKKAGDQ
jgi:hypothetical protein